MDGMEFIDGFCEKNAPTGRTPNPPAPLQQPTSQRRLPPRPAIPPATITTTPKAAMSLKQDLTDLLPLTPPLRQ